MTGHEARPCDDHDRLRDDDQRDVRRGRKLLPHVRQREAEAKAGQSEHQKPAVLAFGPLGA